VVRIIFSDILLVHVLKKVEKHWSNLMRTVETVVARL
jgi:hypothetical protein